MSRLGPILSNIFASLAGTDQIAKFGSLYAGSAAYTTDPEQAQSLSNWLTGWFAAAIGGSSPAIEDMNAVHYAMSYQLAYAQQMGVQEWCSSATYYTGSLVNDGTGNLYVSLTNSNSGNALSNGTYWALAFGTYLVPGATLYASGSGTYTVPTSPRAPLYLEVSMVGAGAGGNGSGTSSPVGGSGGNTVFGTNTAGGGSPGLGSGTLQGGAGGTNTFSLGTLLESVAGGSGQAGQFVTTNNTVSVSAGGGGNSFYGGAGAGAGNGAAGYAAAANSGSGGGGGAATGTSYYSGCGGGAGGFLRFWIPNPSGSYTYSVGGAGTAGSAGSSGYAAGAGAGGKILVKAIYQ